MKKLFTLAAAVLASVSMMAATIDDVEVIDNSYSIYFDDVVSAAVSANTLIGDYFFSPRGNNYATNKGNLNGHLYCLRVKSATQDVLGFKLDRAATLVLYADRVSDRAPKLNTEIAVTGDDLISGEVEIGATGQRWGKVTYTIPAGGTYYIVGTGDCFLAGLEFTLAATTPSLKSITVAGVACDIIEAGVASDPDTIRATLPFGTVVNDAIDAATIKLGGSATTFEIADDHSKLTVFNDGKTASKVYLFDLTVEASASTDATLKSLSLNGVAVALEAETFEYDVNVPYTTSAVVPSYEVNDPLSTAAHEIQADKDKVIITVTAQAGNKQVYTLNYTILPARKALLEATFSNGVHGYITSGKIQIPYLAGTDQPTFVSATFWEPDGEPTAALEDGKLVVTGIDDEKDEYALEFIPITPKELNYDEETFTAVPDYIFSVYGWDSGKGVKFSKDVEEATNHRISEGKDRIYIALPAAGQVILTGGSAGARPVTITINGSVSAVNKTPAEGKTINLSLDKTRANFIGIESNGNNGDAGFTKLQLQQDYPTAVDNAEDGTKAVKFIENGQMFIKKNGVVYNAQGAIVK